MMSDYIAGEHTDSLDLTITEFPRTKEYVVEVFIKDKGFIWNAVLRYQYLPTKAIIFRDTYAHNCKSPRPYKAGQRCDGTITAPVFHLYSQLCTMIGIDPILLYQATYDDRIFTYDQLAETIKFAEWQGVEIIYEWDQKTIDRVMQSIDAVNMHQLADALWKKLAAIHIYIL